MIMERLEIVILYVHIYEKLKKPQYCIDKQYYMAYNIVVRKILDMIHQSNIAKRRN